MPTIKIKLSQGAFDAMMQCAMAQDETIDDYVHGYFEFFENIKDDPEKVERKVKATRESHLKRKARVINRKYPVQRYKLPAEVKGNKRIIAWRLCPIQEYGHVLKEVNDNVGKYYCWIEEWNERPASGNLFFFKETAFRENHFFDTLKEMKTFINETFQKYGYRPKYKVKMPA